MAAKRNDIKAIIRRPPHWMIRFGTVIITLLIAGFLLISTQVSVPHQMDIPVEIDLLALANQSTSSASDSIPGRLLIPPGLNVPAVSSGTIHLSDGAENFTYTAKIVSTADGQTFVQIPRTFQTGRGQSISTNCQIKITLKNPTEDITLYRKLVDALFGSFKI